MKLPVLPNNRVMSYKTRLNPPPANGWTPPQLPPLEDFEISSESANTNAPASRRPRKVKNQDLEIGANELSVPRMLNLFEEAPKTLFDD